MELKGGMKQVILLIITVLFLSETDCLLAGVFAKNQHKAASVDSSACHKKDLVSVDKTDTCDLPCDTYKEFVTTFNYLTHATTSPLTRPDAAAVALGVARGCDGAAARFIRVFDMLTHADVVHSDALNIAQQFGSESNEKAEAFATVFRAAFSRDGLDLDLHLALDLAKALSLDFKGDGDHVKHDFAELVKFCLAQEGLATSRPHCAKLAVEITRLGESENLGVAEPFKELVTFLRNRNDGPKLASYEAVDVARSLLAMSAASAHNFISGYKFATEEAGLKLGRNEAIDFGKKLAAGTRRLQEQSAPKSQPQKR